LLISKKRD